MPDQHQRLDQRIHIELFVFARFHAREGEEANVASTLRDVLGHARAEAGCVAIDAFASTRDPLLFYTHSRWIDQAAFDLHATLPHTVRFIQRMTPPIDHRFEVTRTTVIK
jgi:quinol monooxygenase YgiN